MVSTLPCEEYNLAPIFGKLYTDPLPLDSMVEITRKYKKLYNSILEAREKGDLTYEDMDHIWNDIFCKSWKYESPEIEEAELTRCYGHGDIKQLHFEYFCTRNRDSSYKNDTEKEFIEKYGEDCLKAIYAYAAFNCVDCTIRDCLYGLYQVLKDPNVMLNDEMAIYDAFPYRVIYNNPISAFSFDAENSGMELSDFKDRYNKAKEFYRKYGALWGWT